MISNVSRYLGYRIAIYCEERAPGYKLTWKSLPEGKGRDSDIYDRLLSWGGPRDPLLRNLDIAFRRQLSFSFTRGAWRSDVLKAFFFFEDVLYVHRHLEDSILNAIDVGVDLECWEEAKEGRHVFSPEQYLALKMSMECEDWCDAYYIFYRIISALGSQEETYRLPFHWMKSHPMDEYLNGFDDNVREAMLKARDKKRIAALDKTRKEDVSKDI